MSMSKVAVLIFALASLTCCLYSSLFIAAPFTIDNLALLKTMNSSPADIRMIEKILGVGGPELLALIIAFFTLPCVVLSVLPSLGIWFFRVRRQPARAYQARQHRYQGGEALQIYLDQITELLLEQNLLQAGPDSQARHLAHLQTEQIWQKLDKTPDQQYLLWFLHEIGLSQAQTTERPIPANWPGRAKTNSNGSDLLARVITFLLLLFSALAYLWVGLIALARLVRNPLQPFGLAGNFNELLPGMLSCLIPAIIAALAGAGIWWISKQERNTKQKDQTAWSQFQEQMLQAYFKRLKILSQAHQLRQSAPGALVQKIARAQTLIILPELHGVQKRQLLTVLQQEGLITSPGVIDLHGADLSQAVLDKIDLSQANLAGVSLRQANLVQANLSQANLSHSDLSQADLRFTALSGTNLQQAILAQAKLHRADLRQANLGAANLSQANLWQADLSAANLSQAKVTQTQLTAAKSVTGVIMETRL